ncbi:MAG: Hsp20 family protein [Kiritimatiellae bacterium]|nr:Hsp20 family protein [Kiritimatiellia bacterium]
MVYNIIPLRSNSCKSAQLENQRNNPFRDLDELVDGFFNGFEKALTVPTLIGLTGHKVGNIPRIDMAETDKEIQLTAELPGIDEKEIEVHLEDDLLTISGEKKEEHKDENYHISERSYGKFERVITLPADVDKDHVKAQFKKGVLNIAIPKTAKAQSSRKKIDITTK